MEKVIFIGAGGHSESVADSLDVSRYTLAGFVDQNKEGSHLGVPILGKLIEDVPNYKDYLYFVTIGDNEHRREWFDKIKKLGLYSLNIIDSTAIVSDNVQVGEGNFIGKMAIINAGTVIGDDNIINTRALVEHECRVGSHIHISTNSVVNGDVTVEDLAFLGSSSVCIGQLKVGKKAIVGAGAVVIGDVEPCVTVVGVPAKRKSDR